LIVSVSSRSRGKLERSRLGLVSNKLSNVSVSKEKVSFASLNAHLRPIKARIEVMFGVKTSRVIKNNNVSDTGPISPTL